MAPARVSSPPPLPGIGLPLVLPGLAMIAVCYGLARFSYGLFLPEFRDTFHLTPGLLGLTGAGSYVGYCLSVGVSGYLSPRWGPRAVVIVAGLVCTAGMCLVAAAPDGTVLAAAVLIAGASAGFASPPMGDAVQRRVGQRRQGAANTWINSGTSIGVVVSGPVALLVGGSWRVAWLSFAAAALAVTLWCIPALPGRGTTPAPPARSRSAAPERIRDWINPTTLPLLASSAAMGLVSSVYWTFSRDLVVSRGHMDTTLSMIFWMVIGIAGLAGGLAGRLIRAWGLTTALRCCLVGFGSSIALLAAAPGNTAAAFLSAAAFGAFYILLTGIYLVWSVQVFEKRPSAGIALSFAVLSIGQAAGAPLTGSIADSFSVITAFTAAGALSCLVSLISPRAATPSPASDQPSASLRSRPAEDRSARRE
ncbi:MFS transporter [Streptomyces sp. NPDC052701]|uniref:MFS transporter n=1 Tax=Streptomyces sp. NPDC052701 TaxID=3155533 RepID=UPI003416A8F7